MVDKTLIAVPPAEELASIPTNDEGGRLCLERIRLRNGDIVLRINYRGTSASPNYGFIPRPAYLSLDELGDLLGAARRAGHITDAQIATFIARLTSGGAAA
jgi:hypothetical protein